MSEKKPILQIINEIAAEEDPSPVVLPLMCGAGKSQAISAKMCEAIEKNEGLLVITDRVSRLHSYMDPIDPKVKKYLEDHRDQVVIMEAKGQEAAQKASHFHPVLLMTTQRYFGLSLGKIKEFLSWGEESKRKRRLILIDEKPDLYFQYDISLRLLNKFETAFVENARDIMPGDTLRYIEKYWAEEKAYFLITYNRLSSLFLGLKKFAFLTGYDYPKEDDLPVPVDASEEDNEWVNNANASSHAHQDPLRGFLSYVYMNRREIYKADRNVDPVKIARGFYLRKTKATLFCSYPGANSSTVRYFSTIESEKPKLTDIDAKVIILDGTADITLDYQQDYLKFDYEDCKPYDRKINNLHIRIVKYHFSRTHAQTVTSKQFRLIEKFVQEDSKTETICIFTYKCLLEALGADFEGEDQEIRRDYLGNLKGRNDFQDHLVFAQVGLNYKPFSCYLSILVEQNPDLRKKLIDPQSYQGAGDVKIIEEYMNSKTYKSAVLNDLLADIEQNIFRSPIRNPSCKEDVYYYLFFDYDNLGNQGLKEKIFDRFHNRYGADVLCIDPAQYLCKQKILCRKATKEKTAAQKILEYLATMKDGSVFRIDDLLSQTQLTQKQFNKVKEKNEFIREYFNKMAVEGKRGVYSKKPI